MRDSVEKGQQDNDLEVYNKRRNILQVGVVEHLIFLSGHGAQGGNLALTLVTLPSYLNFTHSHTYLLLYLGDPSLHYFHRTGVEGICCTLNT